MSDEPKLWEDMIHVAINELAPWAVNGILDHLPKEIYDKLLANSHNLQAILPVASGAILRFTKSAPWVDSLTATGFARIREEIEKRAKGKTGAGTGEKTEEKKEEKRVIGLTVRDVLPSIDADLLNEVIKRMTRLSNEKREAFLYATIAKDKAVAICANLAACDEYLFQGMVDMLIVPAEPVIKEVCFKEELIKHPLVCGRLSNLPNDKFGTVRRHIEHIPADQLADRLNSLEAMSEDEFAAYVDAVILVGSGFEEWTASCSDAIKGFFSEGHEKRKLQGGFLAGFKKGYRG